MENASRRGKFFAVNWIVVATFIQCLVACTSQGFAPSAVLGPHSLERSDPQKENLLVFLHGLAGSPEETWGKGQGVWWRKASEDRDFDDFAFLVLRYKTSIFGRAPEPAIVAEKLRAYFKEEKAFSGYKNVFFIAHSMGGVIAQDLLISMSLGKDPNEEIIRAAFLIATPSKGSPDAALLDWLSLNDQVSTLRAGNVNEYLSRLGDNWERYMSVPAKERVGGKKIFSAYETQPILCKRTALPKLPLCGREVVSELYANMKADDRIEPIAADHLSIVKPDTPGGKETYAWVKRKLKLEGFISSPVKRACHIELSWKEYFECAV